MKNSETTDQVYMALINFQQKLPTIKRDKSVKAGKYEYKYAPLDSIVEAIKPLMVEFKLAVMQAVDRDCLTTRLIHASGQWIESETMLHTDQASMQQFGSEITFIRRYAMSALLGIVTDDDTDATTVTRISATKGVLETLPPRRQSMVTDLAEYIKEKFSEGNEYGAYEEYVQITEQEEKIALWGLLPSNVRTCLTKLNKTEREGMKQ